MKKFETLITFVILLALLVNCKVENLENGNSCAFSHHCSSGCCDIGFSEAEVLGFYCHEMTYCNSTLKNPG